MSYRHLQKKCIYVPVLQSVREEKFQTRQHSSSTDRWIRNLHSGAAQIIGGAASPQVRERLLYYCSIIENRAGMSLFLVGVFFTKTGWNQRGRLFFPPPSIWNSRKTESGILSMIRVEYETAELVIAVLSAAPLVGIYQILGWVRRPGGVQGSPLTNLYEQGSLQISETKSFQVRHILKVDLHKRESEINTFFSQHPQKQRSSCWKSVLSSGK